MAELVGTATLFDWNTNREVKVKVEHEEGMLFLSPEGYAHPESDTDGSVVIMQLTENRLQLEVYGSLVSAEPIVIPLESLRKEHRVPDEENVVEDQHAQTMWEYSISDAGIWHRLHKLYSELSNLSEHIKQHRKDISQEPFVLTLASMSEKIEAIRIERPSPRDKPFKPGEQHGNE